MRHFPGLIFLGAGDHSVRLVKLLHARLEEGVSLSGGLQQSSQGRPEDQAEIARLEAERQDVVRDIAAAILGRDVAFGPKLPYPYSDEPLRLYAEKVEKCSTCGKTVVEHYASPNELSEIGKRCERMERRAARPPV